MGRDQHKNQLTRPIQLLLFRWFECYSKLDSEVLIKSIVLTEVLTPEEAEEANDFVNQIEELDNDNI